MKNFRNWLLVAVFALSVFLNFFMLDKNPPGLYIDEAAIGYNAYTILKTGRDEYGVKWPLYFRSFGDYKLPVYIYLTSVSIFLFGKNELAVRIPSALFGTLIIPVLYLLLIELLSIDKKECTKVSRLPLLTVFLLSVSPWFQQFVGPAFETTAALFFFILASYLYLIFLKNKKVPFLILSTLFYIITLYTYHSYRVVTPIIYLLILTFTFRKFPDLKKNIFWGALIFFACILPVSLSVFSVNGATRFLQTSAFPVPNSHNLLTVITSDPALFLKNYLSYFSLKFLFNFGDGIGRHQLLDFGPLSRWELPFLLIGIYYFIKAKNSPVKNIVFLLFIIAPIPASLALPSPHTLRSLMMVIPYTIFISCGLYLFIRKNKRKSILFPVLITFIFVYEFSYYLHYDYLHYPKTSIVDWGGNYKGMVEKAGYYRNKYKVIAVRGDIPYAYIYFRFYNEDLNPIFVSGSWDKNKNYPGQKVLYITGHIDLNGAVPSNRLLETVKLANDNRDIFAEFWEI